MSSQSRIFVAWFCAGILLPPAVYGLGALLDLVGAAQASRAAELLALGGCPFWLFLWVPAMSQPNNSVLFYSTVVGVLVSNGCLYLLMAVLQSKIQLWRKPQRVVTLAVAYPALMALGYALPLSLEAR